VQHPIAGESNENDDEDQMDDMIDGIGMGVRPRVCRFTIGGVEFLYTPCRIRRKSAR
jgi:hypothetical protein